MDIAGADLLCMFIMSLVMWAALFFIEYMISRGSVENLM